MKKTLLVLLLVMLSTFMFRGMAQARECIYLGSVEGRNYYYDPSEVQHSGYIVNFIMYEDNCSSPAWEWFLEIDCSRGMIREELIGEWEAITPGSFDDTLRIKFCR